MKLLITGASGFVGSHLVKAFPDAIACPSLRNISEEEIKQIVEEADCEAIIHTAAIADIPTCEKDPDASYDANVLLPYYLSKAAGDRRLICFSTDQVYSGCDFFGPYKEEDAKPANTYADHKLLMEKMVLDANPDVVLLRAQWMYDMISPKMNYIKILTQGDDHISFSKTQYRGMTYVKEVIENVPALLKVPGGVYNFGSETDKSMYELTEWMLTKLHRDQVSLSESAPRHNLWMDCGKAKNAGICFSTVENALLRCAKDYNLL